MSIYNRNLNNQNGLSNIDSITVNNIVSPTIDLINVNLSNQSLDSLY